MLTISLVEQQSCSSDSGLDAGPLACRANHISPRPPTPASCLCAVLLCAQVETLTEIASIIKRLAGDEWGLQALVQCSVHDTLTQLLNSNGVCVEALLVLQVLVPSFHPSSQGC